MSTSNLALDLALDGPDEATRPVRGRVIVSSERAVAAPVEVALRFHAVGPNRAYSQETSRLELAGGLAAGRTELSFEVPAQTQGWTWDDGGAFRCVWQLEATTTPTEGAAVTAVRPLFQAVPEGALLTVKPKRPPRLDLVETRSFARLLAMGAAAIIAVASIVMGRFYWTSQALVIAGVFGAIFVAFPFVDAILVFRQRGRLGTAQFDVDRPVEAGYRGKVVDDELRPDGGVRAQSWAGCSLGGDCLVPSRRDGQGRWPRSDSHDGVGAKQAGEAHRERRAPRRPRGRHERDAYWIAKDSPP